MEQACDVGIPNGFHVPRRTCKASLGRRDAVDQHKCRNSFEVLNRDLAIEESEVWVNKVDVVGEKLTRLSAMAFNETDVKNLWRLLWKSQKQETELCLKPTVGT